MKRTNKRTRKRYFYVYFYCCAAELHSPSELSGVRDTNYSEDGAHTGATLQAIVELDQHVVTRVGGEVVTLHHQHARSTHGSEVAAMSLQTETETGTMGFSARLVLAAAPSIIPL